MMRKKIIASFVIFGASTTGWIAAAGDSYRGGGAEFLKLLPDDGTAGDELGYSVAISGATAVAGAWLDDENGIQTGSAYVFDAVTGLQQFKLLPDDGAVNDRFGESVSVSGILAIVGAGFDDNRTGSAYIFDTTTGQQQFKLVASDGAESDRFGVAVAISGGLAIVGSPGDDDRGNSSGSAYVFDVATGLQLRKLLPSDGTFADQFGGSVAISGTLAVIGANQNDDNGGQSGSAYVFDALTGMQLHKLLPDDGAGEDRFGSSVAIQGDLVLIGAPLDDDNGANAGSAYAFDADSGQQLFKMLPGDGAAGDQFGISVAISGAVAVVGAPFNDDNGDESGSAYAFNSATGQQLLKLTPADGAEDDEFGGSVAISAGITVAGATGDDDNGSTSGSVYAFGFSQPNPSDLNGDSIVDTADLGILLNEFGTAGTGSDINGDGIVDTADLGILLNAFGD